MQRLIKELHRDNKDAFKEIYASTYQKIYHFIFRYVRTESHAEELTQLFFVKIWRNRLKLSAEKSLESQMFVIAKNLVIDELRKISREREFIQDYLKKGGAVSEETEQTVLYDNLQDKYEQAIESLPARRKEIFKLSYQRGLTHREIAHQLSLSPKTVEVQISKALKVIRARLHSFLYTLL